MFRVLIVDDEAPIRRAWRMLLAMEGYEVPEAGSCAEARCLLRDEQVHLVLLDLTLPQESGTELLPDLGALDSPPFVIVVSGHTEPERSAHLQLEGLLVLRKPVSGEALCSVVAEVLSSEAEDVVSAYAQAQGLSGQEAQLVRLHYEGVPREEIAERLGIAEATERTYWQRVYAKTGCSSRVEVLAALARFAAARRPTPPRGLPRLGPSGGLSAPPRGRAASPQKR